MTEKYESKCSFGKYFRVNRIMTHLKTGAHNTKMGTYIDRLLCLQWKML